MIPKFRAWDKERQKWSPYSMQSLNHVDEVFILFFDTVQGVWYSNEDIKDNWVLMQSTGIKDKNNKEIFEGDNLKYTSEWKNTRTEIIGEVVIEKGTALLKGIKKYYVDGELVSNGDPKFVIFSYYLETEKLEIIGNIYENPELINQ